MIIESIVNILVNTVMFIFNLFPDLPEFPKVKAPFEAFSKVLGYGLDILSVFLDISLFKPFLVVVLALVLGRKVYFLLKFIISKFKLN